MSSSRSVRWAVHLVATAFLAVAAGLVLPGGPAAAATCSGGHGVSVVVDFHGLGGRSAETTCMTTGSGKSARSLFKAAGFQMEDVQSQQGFVCRIDGLPTQDDESCVRTPPASKYWALYWSNGTSGKWTYASSGVDSQTAPDGGSVAFSWTGTGSSAPSVAPPRHATSPSPSPSSHPTSGSGSTHSTHGTPSHSPSPTSAPSTSRPPTPSVSASAAPSASETPRAGHDRRGHAKHESVARPHHHRGGTSSPTAAATGSATATAEQTVAPSSEGTTTADPAKPDGGLPSWVAPVVILLLFGVAGGAAVVRRRRAGGA